MLVYLALLINSKRAYHLAHHIPTHCAWLISKLWLVRVKLSGTEHFDPTAQYIFVGNHRSMLDAILSCGFIPNPKKFIGKSELVSYPFIGYILKKIYIPVDRKDKASRAHSKTLMIDKLKEGYSLVVFAEGKTNSGEEPLLPFKDGAFETGHQLSLPILPFVIDKADQLWSRKVWLIKPGTIRMTFLQPMLATKDQADGDQMLKEKVFQAMKDEYLRLQN